MNPNDLPLIDWFPLLARVRHWLGPVWRPRPTPGRHAIDRAPALIVTASRVRVA